VPTFVGLICIRFCVAFAEAVVSARVAVPLAGNEGAGGVGRRVAAHHLPNPRELAGGVRKYNAASVQVRVQNK